MIPVVQAPAPADFDERVKKPGLDAIAELVGETPKTSRPGPKRKFEIQHGLFALEFFGFEVTVGVLAVGALEAKVADTIEQLGLNMPDCCKARREYFDNYRRRDITLDYLERRAPFIARELRRQGRLNAGDI